MEAVTLPWSGDGSINLPLRPGHYRLEQGSKIVDLDLGGFVAIDETVPCDQSGAAGGDTYFADSVVAWFIHVLRLAGHVVYPVLSAKSVRSAAEVALRRVYG